MAYRTCTDPEYRAEPREADRPGRSACPGRASPSSTVEASRTIIGCPWTLVASWDVPYRSPDGCRAVGARGRPTSSLDACSVCFGPNCPWTLMPRWDDTARPMTLGVSPDARGTSWDGLGVPASRTAGCIPGRIMRPRTLGGHPRTLTPSLDSIERPGRVTRPGRPPGRPRTAPPPAQFQSQLN